MRVSIVCVVVCTLLVSGCAGTLSDDGTPVSPDAGTVPDAFSETAVVVVPDSPSTVEAATADRVASRVRAVTGTEPDIVSASAVTETQRAGALIVVGEFEDGRLARFASEANVSGEFEALEAREGRVVTTRNPWNRSQPLILLGGADAAGLWAGADELVESDNATGNDTATFEPVSRSEIDRLDTVDTIGATVRTQAQTKRAYFTRGPEATDGTYLEGADQSRLLFQRVNVYTTDRFDNATLEALRDDGIRVSQDRWVGDGDGGSYSATVPLDQLARLGNHSRVTTIETRENAYSVESLRPAPQRHTEAAG